MKLKKAIVLGSSKGIGKAIADQLSYLNLDVTRTSSKILDTSNITRVKNFIKKYKNTDILVLNTGGPPPVEFKKVTEKQWLKYHNQLFLSFCIFLQKMIINKGGYIFLITSFNIKEPNSKLVLSNSYRVAFTSIFKTLSVEFAKKKISCINIAPGPIKTKRLYSLVKNMKAFEKKLPMGRAGNPEEIGLFVKSIVENDIKYLSGATINFDGGKSSFIF